MTTRCLELRHCSDAKQRRGIHRHRCLTGRGDGTVDSRRPTGIIRTVPRRRALFDVSELARNVPASRGCGANGIGCRPSRSIHEPAKNVVGCGETTSAVGREGICPGRKYGVEFIPDALDGRRAVVVIVERTLAAAA